MRSLLSLVTLVLIIFLIVSCSQFGIAQNSALPTQTWNVSYSQIALPGAKQTFAGTEAAIGVSPTTNSTVFDENILAIGSPTFNGFYGGGAAYDFPAISLKLNNASETLSGFRFRIGVMGSLGVDRNNVGSGTKQNYAGTVGGRIRYSIDSGNTWNLAIEARAARFPNFAPGWIPLISAGVAKLW